MKFEWVYVLVLAELFLVAWIDIRKARISNYWFVINLLLALGFYIVPGQEYLWSWDVLLFPVGFIVVGFLLFLVNIMGAGDSKYLASLFLLVPLKYHYDLFERILLTTILLGLISLIMNLIKEKKKVQAFAVNRYWKGAFEAMKSRFSYAPVILIAWVSLGIFLWS